MIKFKPTEPQVVRYYTSSLTSEELKDNLDVYLSLALRAFTVLDHNNLFQFLQEEYLESYLQTELSKRVSQLKVYGTTCVVENNGTKVYNHTKLSISLLIALLSLRELGTTIPSFREFSFLEPESLREIVIHYGSNCAVGPGLLDTLKEASNA